MNLSDPLASDWQRWTMPSVHVPAPPGADAAPEISAQAQAEAQAREQQRQLEAVLAQAHAEGFAQGLAEGRETGLGQGIEEGRRQGLEQARPLVAEQCAAMQARLDALLAGTQANLESLNAEVGQAILTMGLRVAERIIGAALHEPDEILATAVTATLKALDAPLRIIVTAHPDTLEMLRRAGLAVLHAKAHWQWEADAGLGPMDYLIRTNTGEIDARLHTRWNAACESLGLGPVGPTHEITVPEAKRV